MASITDKVVPAHTTGDEIKFLNNIGSFTAKQSPERTAKALRGYLASLARRVFWGDIDREAVVKHAQKLCASA